MELSIKEYQLPEQITFNYEELKAELQEKVSMYETTVYTDDQIKLAKDDRAKLNKLKKALNDERIAREKDYMQPFNQFKAQINEIIGIIDKPIAVIDRQVKEYEEKQRQDKLETIKEYFETVKLQDFPLELEQIMDCKWLNASVSMKLVQAEIDAKLEQIKNALITLQNLPEFGFEALEVYKTTLDINKAISEGKRLAEIAKKKAEAEAKKQEEQTQAITPEEFAQHMNPPVEEVAVGTVTAEANVNGQTVPVAEIPVNVPAKQWVSFRCLLSVEDAQALGQFFTSRNIAYEQI